MPADKTPPPPPFDPVQEAMQNAERAVADAVAATAKIMQDAERVLSGAANPPPAAPPPEGED